jgi:hypothetical protein
VVEQRTENPRVSSSTLLLGTRYAIIGRGRLAVDYSFPYAKLVRGLGLQEQTRRSGGKVDATVSKTVGGQPPCRFESDLRHHDLRREQLSVPGCVAVAQRTLDPLAQVRILARQPTSISSTRLNT